MRARVLGWLLVAILAVAAFVVVQSLVPAYDPAVVGRPGAAPDDPRGPPPSPRADTAPLPAASAPAPAAEDPAQRALDRASFAIRFDGPPDPTLAERALDILADARADLRKRLGVVSPPPVEVLLFTGAAGAAALSASQWEVARVDGRIRISQADLAAAARGRVGALALRCVLYHQALHAALFAAPSAPAWLSEGLAEWVEPADETATTERRRELVSRAVRAGKALTLAELKRGFVRFDDEATAELAYAQSLSLVEYLFARGGDGRLPALVTRLTAGEGFEALLDELYVVDLARLGADWAAWVTSPR